MAAAPVNDLSGALGVRGTTGTADTDAEAFGLDRVVGVYPVVHRLRSTVVAPWRSASLGDPLVEAPRRVLIYGPPHGGEAFIARCLADELELVAQQPSLVFDDLDQLAAADSTELTNILEGHRRRGPVVIAVSRRPWDLPEELMSPMAGSRRFDRLVFVTPPDWEARRFRIWETRWGQQLDAVDLDVVVTRTEGWAGGDLRAVIGVGSAELRGAAEPGAVTRYLAGVGNPPPDTAVWFELIRPVVTQWSAQGRVDDLLAYAQRYRLF